MRLNVVRQGILLLALIAFGTAPSIQGAAFTPGNVVVVRLGNGKAAVSAQAQAVSLVEYTTTGTLVQTINFDTTGSDAFTINGNTVNNGVLSLSSSGFMTLAGYNANVGSTNPSTATAAAVNRVVARVGVDGSVDTSTKLNNAYNNVAITSAATSDGNQIWVSGASGVAGTNGGLRATTLGSSTTTGLGASPDSNSTRQVQAINGNLFVGGSGPAPGRAVFKVGQGSDVGTGPDPNLPTMGSPSLLAATAIAPAGKQYNSFYFTNLGGQDWQGTGFDTLYALNISTGVLEKWSFNGSAWNQRGSIISSGILNVSGVTQGSTVSLYVTSASALSRLTDTSGYDSTITGSLSSVVSAGPNFAFRGVTVIPAAIPEPGSLALCALAGSGLAAAVVRRRKARTQAT